MRDAVIEIIATILAFLFVTLFSAWAISWCLTPFFATFGLPTLTPLAVLGLMIAVSLFITVIKFKW